MIGLLVSFKLEWLVPIMLVSNHVMAYLTLFQTKHLATKSLDNMSLMRVQDALFMFYNLVMFLMNWIVLYKVYPKRFILNSFPLESVIIYLGVLRKIFGVIEVYTKIWAVCNFFICILSTTMFYFLLNKLT